MSIKKLKTIFLINWLFYLLISLVFLRYYRFRYDFDTISYLSASKLVAQGRFQEAINGYRGPILSWIMAPSFIFKLDPLLTLKIIQILFGGFFILVFSSLLIKLISSKVVFFLTLLIASLLAVQFSSWHTTPDMLFYAILIYYLTIFLSSSYSRSWLNGLKCGLIGGLSYLIKPYGIFFFPLHFGLASVFIYFIKRFNAEERKGILRNFILGALLFLIISGSWIAILTQHYGEFTVSRAASELLFYRDVIMRCYKGKAQPFPSGPVIFELTNHEKNGFLEECKYLDEVVESCVKTNKIKRKDIFFIVLNRLPKSIYSFFVSCLTFSVFSIAIIMGTLLYAFFSTFSSPKKFILWVVTFAVVIYLSGLIILDQCITRYLFFVFILILLLGSSLLNEIWKSNLIDYREKKFLLACLLLSFVIIPIKNAVMFRYADKEIFDISQHLKIRYGIKGRLSSQLPHNSYLVSLYLNSEFFPVLSNDPLAADVNTALLENSLKDYNIDYYLVWENREAVYPFLNRYKELLNGAIPGLKIYSLKEPL